MDITVHGYYCSLVLYYSPQYSRKTGLHCASKGDHHDIVRVLLERGADPNTRDNVSGVYIIYTYVHMYNVHVYMWVMFIAKCFTHKLTGFDIFEQPSE